MKRLLLTFILLIGTLSAQEETAEPVKKPDTIHIQGHEVIRADDISMSLKDLFQLTEKVHIASFFLEDESLVGSSVALIKNSEWATKGDRLTLEALNHLPGMSMVNANSRHAISIRGYTNSIPARGTSLMLDGVPLNTFSHGTGFYTAYNIGLGILDHMEVVRGPGSALYGSDAFQGVISLNTHKNQGNYFELEGEGASNSYYSSSLNWTRKLNNKLQFQILGDLRGQGAQGVTYDYYSPDPSVSADTGEYDLEYLSLSSSLKFDYKITDDMDIKFSAYYNKFDSENYPGFGTIGGSLTIDERSGKDIDSELVVGKVNFQWALPADIMLDLKSYYWYAENGTDIDLPLNFADSTGSSVSEDRYSFEAILKQADNDFHTQWVASLSYQRFNIQESFFYTKASPTAVPISGGGFSIPPPVSSSGTTNADGFHREVASFLVQAKTDLWDERIYLIYGARLDDYSDFGVQFTPRLGLIYRPNEQNAIKLLYGNAFRAPTAIEVKGNSSLALPNDDLEPETIDSYELVYMFSKKHFKLNLTGFRTFWDEGIQLERVSQGSETSAIYSNTGENESYGAEFEAKFVYENWGFDMNGSYVRSKNTKTDLEYSTFPKWIINNGAFYAFDLDDSKLTFNINNRMQWDYKEGLESETFSYPDIKRYFRTDCSVTWDKEPFQLSLKVRNLFDRKNELPIDIDRFDPVNQEGISALIAFAWKF